jgi:adenosylcobyric acid synthase
VFAAFHGTVALLEAADQRLIAGFVVNKFRGDPALLAPGLEQLRNLTGRPMLGVLPWQPGLWMDAEDSLTLDAAGAIPGAVGRPAGDLLRVAAVRLPRISNLTDLDALAAEPGVVVRFVTTPEEIADADLVVLPGTRATVSDLAWLRRCGLADAVTARAAAGRPVLGVCGGYQMLARTITDDVESRAGAVAGLGLLPADVVFEPRKTVGRTAGEELGQPVRGYEIHHGRVSFDPGTAPFLDGCRSGVVWGTTWHGALESDGFRRAFLGAVATAAGRNFRPVGEVSFAAVREARFDVLGDLVADHLDERALDALITGGAPRGLPFVRSMLESVRQSGEY